MAFEHDFYLSPSNAALVSVVDLQDRARNAYYRTGFRPQRILLGRYRGDGEALLTTEAIRHTVQTRPNTNETFSRFIVTWPSEISGLASGSYPYDWLMLIGGEWRPFGYGAAIIQKGVRQ